VNRSHLPLAAALILLLLTAPAALAFPDYYSLSALDKAQAEARERNLPLAWLGSNLDSLTVGAPDPGSVADLTQMALSTLQGNAVVVFFDGRGSMNQVPAIVHAQYHIHDDGKAAGTADWVSPKVVFSNADVSKILGRVSYSEMKADRDIPLNSALQIIRNDPTSLAPAPASASASASATNPASATEQPGAGTLIVKAYGPSAKRSADTGQLAVVILQFVNTGGASLAVVALVIVALITLMIVNARRR